MIPIHPVLASVLSASQCSNLTFLVTEFGKPFTAVGFGNWFRDRCDAASLPECSFHGLRKAAATRLAGWPQSRPDQSGHRTSLRQRGRALYKKADQTRLARQALDRN